MTINKAAVQVVARYDVDAGYVRLLFEKHDVAADARYTFTPARDVFVSPYVLLC